MQQSKYLGGLRRFNIVMGFFHAIQGIAVLALSSGFALPVTATFLEGPPSPDAEIEITRMFDISIGLGVATFLFLSAIAHWTISLPRVYQWYERNLGRDRNYARWIEYSASSSVMVVLIAMLTGISDVVALLALFSVNATMILFGLLVEHYETPGNTDWLSYWFGVFAGAIPWIAIGIYLWSPTTSASPPGFVYGIFFSLFIFFNTFAINQVLQYKQVGKWRDYVYGERAYIILSLVAKSLLAWQVFGGTLAPT